VAGERGYGAENRVGIFVGEISQVALGRQDSEGFDGEDGNVSVARGDVKPSEADLLEMGGKDQRGEDRHAVGLDEMGHVVKDSGGIGGVFEHFEAEDQIELPMRLLGKFGDNGIVGFDVGETVLAQLARQRAVSAAVVEDTKGLGEWREIRHHGVDIFFRSNLKIVGIDLSVLIVVNPSFEIGRGELIEGGGEEESAGGATVIIDRDAGPAELGVGAFGGAGLEEIDHDENFGRLAATFARSASGGDGI